MQHSEFYNSQKSSRSKINSQTILSAQLNLLLSQACQVHLLRRGQITNYLRPVKFSDVLFDSGSILIMESQFEIFMLILVFFQIHKWCEYLSLYFFFILRPINLNTFFFKSKIEIVLVWVWSFCYIFNLATVQFEFDKFKFKTWKSLDPGKSHVGVSESFWIWQIQYV